MRPMTFLDPSALRTAVEKRRKLSLRHRYGIASITWNACRGNNAKAQTRKKSLSHHSANICRRTDLDRSTVQLHSRRLGNELNGVLQIKLSDMFSTCRTRDSPNRC